MSTLHYYFHPIASFCWKPLIALYENETAFERHVVDLGDPKQRAELAALWPPTKFPVLKDGARVVPESTVIIEYLAQHHPGPVALLPGDADALLEVRLYDRFFDAYVQEPMQAIVGDRIRPAGKGDAFGVEQAQSRLLASYDFIEARMVERTWAVGDSFTMADCAAAPGLYYADRVVPIGDRPHTTAYLRRLLARPSFARVLEEAAPLMHLFPG